MHIVVRCYEAVLAAGAFAAATLLFAVAVGIGLDVAARYLFEAPIGWVFEFVQHSMVLIPFLGLGWITRHREHVVVDVLINALPAEARRRFQLGAEVVAGAVSLFVACWAVITALDNLRRGVLTDGIYPIPRGWLLLAVAFGLALAGIEFARSAWLTATTKVDAAPVAEHDAGH